MSNLKMASARRQLGTALALYLQDLDPVSVHYLAGGGCELIEYYAKKAGAQPFTSHAIKTFPEMKIQEIRKLQRQFWNAFKHATQQHSGEERHDDDLLMQFSDEQNDHALFIGWYDYAGATNAMPIEAQVHQAWYLALHPDKLASQFPSDLYERVFPKLNQRSRPEQKRMLNEVIAHSRTDNAVMSDPATETLALISNWPPI
ncbi:hypothetical protein [Bradyrhizobium acaciae]|uniref:hypothetical protein n=1 Tax=Bradyrhizobium acaciae TaxID=2683706 RepID=UPI001E2BB144|nr:hypothetical protein [Bradyrhizobium acaciae]MCC8982641.1 hypothetical protein [Bradyrhizobium acaciae]